MGAVTLCKDITVGKGRVPVMVAETGVLSFGDLGLAKRFVDAASRIGLKLLKFQAADPNNIVSRDVDAYLYKRMKKRMLNIQMKVPLKLCMPYSRWNSVASLGA